MEFVRWREYLETQDIVEVGCTDPCTVRLMSDHDFERYKAGAPFCSYDSFWEALPALIPAPSKGVWNIVLEIEGDAACAIYGMCVCARDT